jgi:hypothetical protein
MMLAKPFQLGTPAFMLMPAIYSGVVSLISGQDFAIEKYATRGSWMNSSGMIVTLLNLQVWSRAAPA